MGKVYAGEEINIYMENFITLPEGGSYVFDWMLEGEFRKPIPLPSNFKLSTSGRSIKVKELKKFQTGIIACIMYSPTGIAVAKRRFSIQKVFPRDRKRSLLRRREQDKWVKQQKRRSLYSKCLQTLSDHSAEDILKLSSKPISHCKRRHLRSRLHPRWAIPFLGGYETTSDPRVMSIQKLVELSENSDGTLDNLIPREVHYVEPVVSVVTDYFRSFLKPPDFQPNCSIDSDCGEGALCVIPLDQDGSSKMDNVVMCDDFSIDLLLRNCVYSVESSLLER
ncbi:EGF-like domain-containing protein [Trichonephila clavata]|uniref:EGF-like domain-containing protein n=1 Tax=Trichonephila clavata TaxID=2740835 RepID=A0A8X6G2Z7_TRICU|nr:EGF-like domain-containing protein [Trichonephila clavata]